MKHYAHMAGNSKVRVLCAFPGTAPKRPYECDWAPSRIEDSPHTKGTSGQGSSTAGVQGLSVPYLPEHRLGTLINTNGAVVDAITPFSTRVVEAKSDEGPAFRAANPRVCRHMVSSEEDMSSALEAGGGISASGWGASMTASGSYMKSSMSKVTHVYMVVGAFVEQAGESHTYKEPPCLSKYAVGKLQNSEDVFEKEFGKYFISGFKRQAWYTAVMDISSSSVSEQQSTRASLEVSYRGMLAAGGSTHASQLYGNMSQSHTVTVRAQASGWSATRMEMFPSTPEAMMDGVTSFVSAIDLSAAIPVLSILTPFNALPHYANIVAAKPTATIPSIDMSECMVQLRKWLLEVDNIQQHALYQASQHGGGRLQDLKSQQCDGAGADLVKALDATRACVENTKKDAAYYAACWLQVYDVCATLMLELNKYDAKCLRPFAPKAESPSTKSILGNEDFALPTCHLDNGTHSDAMTALLTSWMNYTKTFSMVLTKLKTAKRLLDGTNVPIDIAAGWSLSVSKEGSRMFVNKDGLTVARFAVDLTKTAWLCIPPRKQMELALATGHFSG